MNAQPDKAITASNQECIATLLIRARDLHEAAQTAGATVLRHAMDAGDALIQIQKQVSSPWKAWLAANCSIPVRTAQLYMQLAHHRTEIEAHLEELSLRGALRLITKSKTRTSSKTSRPAEVSLESVWKKASVQERAAFCDAVGLAGFRKVWSLSFHRELLDSVRVQKAEAEPVVGLTRMLWTALAQLASIDEPDSSEIMRKANTNTLLNALRALSKAVRAAGSSKEVAVSIVAAGTIPTSPAERNKKKRAA